MGFVAIAISHHPDRPDRSAQGSLALPATAVTCPETYELETQSIFDRHWLCLGHVSRFETSRNQWQVHCDQRDVLLVREPDGSWNSFANVCRHRGARLLKTGESCQRATIQCPYHAWTWKTDGALASAPNMGSRHDFKADDFPLQPLPTRVWNGLLFICPGKPVTALDTFLSPLDDVARQVGLNQLKHLRTVSYDVAANWKLIFHNYSECYHCPGVHPSLNRLTPYLGSTNDLEEGPLLGGPMQLAEGCETMSSDGRLVGPRLPGLPEDAHSRVSYYTIFPNLFFSPHPDYVLLHRLTRLSPDRTRVACDFLFHAAAEAFPAENLDRAVDFWDEVNRQDWEVCERTQSGMSDPAYQPGPYSDLESIVAAFDRHYRTEMRSQSMVR